jgi:hypothetical protein
VDIRGIDGSDWRAGFRTDLPNVPDWFERDRAVNDFVSRSGDAFTKELPHGRTTDGVRIPGEDDRRRRDSAKLRGEVRADVAKIIRGHVPPELCPIP